MKNKKTVKVKVRPRRITRAERKRIKRAQKAAEQLLLCRQAIRFHKAYLQIELEHEEIKYDELQARLAALQAVTETIETVETVETVEAPAPVQVEETVDEKGTEEKVTEEAVAQESAEAKEEEVAPAPAQ